MENRWRNLANIVEAAQQVDETLHNVTLCDTLKLLYGPVAQWIEHQSSELGVGGSSPSWTATYSCLIADDARSCNYGD